MRIETPVDYEKPFHPFVLRLLCLVHPEPDAWARQLAGILVATEPDREERIQLDVRLHHAMLSSQDPATVMAAAADGLRQAWPRLGSEVKREIAARLPALLGAWAPHLPPVYLGQLWREVFKDASMPRAAEDIADALLTFDEPWRAAHEAGQHKRGNTPHLLRIGPSVYEDKMLAGLYEYRLLLLLDSCLEPARCSRAKRVALSKVLDAWIADADIATQQAAARARTELR